MSFGGFAVKENIRAYSKYVGIYNIAGDSATTGSSVLDVSIDSCRVVEDSSDEIHVIAGFEGNHINGRSFTYSPARYVICNNSVTIFNGKVGHKGPR